MLPILVFSDTINDQTYTVGEDASLTLPIATGGRSPLTYTLEGLPNGFSFDADSRILSGTPTLVGTSNVIYTVTGSADATATLEFVIDITANTPPTITGSTALNYIENSDTPVATYSADDIEGNAITWSLSGTDMASFTIDNSGVLTFNSSPDFENPADIGANNIYEVTLIATDDNAITPASSTLEVSVTVTNLDEDGIVTITGTVQVGMALTAQLTDPDGSVSNVTYQWLRDGGNIDGATATIYVLTNEDVDSTVQVIVNYDDDIHGGGKSVTSDPTAVVTLPDAPNAPTIALFEDTGVDNDGITNNGVIFVSNLEDGATWQYSTSSGESFTQGGAISSGVSSFVLAEGVYSANQVQVRQIVSGVTSTIASFLSEITLDTTLPIIAIANPTLNIARDTSYIPTATINERGILEISGDTLNTGVLGTYNIIFTATDIAANSATATQVIIVGPTTPSAPRDLSATPGNGEVSLSWNVPDDDGDSPITGYQIASKTGNMISLLSKKF